MTHKCHPTPLGCSTEKCHLHPSTLQITRVVLYSRPSLRSYRPRKLVLVCDMYMKSGIDFHHTMETNVQDRQVIGTKESEEIGSQRRCTKEIARREWYLMHFRDRDSACSSMSLFCKCATASEAVGPPAPCSSSSRMGTISNSDHN
jgi:hypothetical protein